MSIAQRSAQIGITVHGTHRSLVENNVMWDVAAAGIYTEDGNEMFNTPESLDIVIRTFVSFVTNEYDKI